MPQDGDALIIASQQNVEFFVQDTTKGVTALHRISSTPFTPPEVDAAFVVTNNDNRFSSGVGIVAKGSGLGDGVAGESDTGAGVSGFSESPEPFFAGGVTGAAAKGVGVLGTCNDASSGQGPLRVGVRGITFSAQGTGVLGQMIDVFSVQGGTGVRGVALSGRGVSGESGSGPGVSATSVRGTGLFAQSQSGSAITAFSATGGALFAQTNAGDGLLALSGSGSGATAFGGPLGVWGRATLEEGRGIYGLASADRGIGVFGEAAQLLDTVRDGIGVFGRVFRDESGSFGNSWAGRFEGPVLIDGDVRVTGTVSSGVVTPDGSLRLLHSIQSPEDWFEDFGEARLTRGKATVKLDRDFGTVVRADRYLVFLTPRGNCNGLCVTSQNQSGFVVQELNDGKTSVRFSYRVVAKRKDLNPRRLERIKLTPAPARRIPKIPKPQQLPKMEPLPEVSLPTRSEIRSLDRGKRKLRTKPRRQRPARVSGRRR